MRRLVFLVALLWCSQAMAQVTGIGSNPPNPRFGDHTNYWAAGDTSDVDYCVWETRYVGSCPLQWKTFPSQQTMIGFFENCPGVWDIRLTVTYFSGDWDVFEKTTVILPPNKVTITQGIGVQCPPAQWAGIEMKFRIDRDNQPCGNYMMNVTPQEKITEHELFSPPFRPGTPNPPDSDWVPDSPEQMVYGMWWLENNEIHDVKKVIFTPEEYAPLPVGGAISRFRQQIRLKVIDPCGDTQYFYLADIVFENYKSSASTWSIRVIED